MIDDYKFESLETPKKDPDEKRKSSRFKLRKTQTTIVLLALIILGVGLKWRLSIGGKLLIISGIGWLVTVILDALKYEVKLRHKAFALVTVIFSVLVSFIGYSNSSYKDLRFTQNDVQRPVNEGGQIYLKNYEAIDNSKLMVLSSNDKVAQFEPISSSLLCFSEGNATLSVRDRYGHKTALNVTCYDNGNAYVKSSFRSYVIQDESVRFSVSSSSSYDESNFDFYGEDDILWIQGIRIIGRDLGTTWIRHNHEDEGAKASEISVLEKGTFVLDVNFIDWIFGVGDKVPLEKLLDSEAKGKEITTANIGKGLVIEDGMVSFTESGTFKGDFMYGDTTESISITVGASSLQAVYAPQVKYETLIINEKTPLELIAVPTYSSLDGLRVISMDDSIVKVEDGNLIPVSKGETEIIIVLRDSKKSFRVIYE